MTTASKTPPPPAQPPSRPPVQPRRPPNKPNSPPIDPPSRGLTGDLASADQLVRLVQLFATDRLTGMDPADRVRLDYGLDLARRAITESQTPARLRPRSVGPDRAGSPPAPGAGTFSTPKPSGPPSFEIGTGPLYDALPPVPWPGRRFPVYDLDS